MRSCGRAARFISFDIQRGSADLGAEDCMRMLRSEHFFLCLRLGEVSEHGYHKMAVQVLAPIEAQELDRQHEGEARKSKVVVTEAFAESSKCRVEILKFLKPIKVHFPRRACVHDGTDAWCQCLCFRTRANVGKLFDFEWSRVQICRHEIFALRVCTTIRLCAEKGSKNVNRLASYSFVDFRKLT